jgi:nucleotide-binding universal stress UspA family protein
MQPKGDEARRRPILVALDGSPQAPAVLTAALEMARTIDAPLALLRAVRWPVELPASLYVGDDPAVMTKLAEESRRELAALARDVPSTMMAGLHVAVGPPWQAICDEGKRLDARLIVIGAHGYGGLERLVGTTAARVVNHADRSVLVVR